MKRIHMKGLCLSLGLALTTGTSLYVWLEAKQNENMQVAGATYTGSSLPKTIYLDDNTEEEIRSYYSALNSRSENERSGNNLLIQLKTILSNGQKYYNYDNGDIVWKMYEITDRDWAKSPATQLGSLYNASTNTISNYTYLSNDTYNNSGALNPYVKSYYMDYTQENQVKAWGNHSQDGYGINREHLWAKAEGFDDDSSGAGARGDPMHLVCANGYANNIHSNYFYGYVDKNKTYLNTKTKYSSVGNNYRGSSKTHPTDDLVVFEPQDEDKGDIARAMFYMAARYNDLAGNDNTIGGANPNLRLTTDLSKWENSGYTSSKTTCGYMGLIDDLLEWNRLDPPDEYEKHRNNLLYTNFTNNRNPFIDFPEWAEYIWGKSVNGSYNSASTGFANPSSDTIGDFGNGSVNPNPTVNSVTVSPSSLELDLNGTITGNLTANVSVSNGASQLVTWTSSDSTVATVSSSGVVTAVAVGTCSITATSDFDANKKASCNVEVIDSSSGGGGTTVSGTYTINLKVASYDANPTANLVTWTTDYLTLTNEKYNSNTAANNYLGGDSNNRTSTRFYTNNKITILPALDCDIKSLIFNATSTGYADALGNSDWTNASASASDSTVTITPTNGKNEVYAIISANCGFTSVVINYEQTISVSSPLDRLSLDTSNVQKEFCIGDSFNSTGLVVTAIYENGNRNVVAPTSISTPDMSTAGNKTVTVTYTEGGVTKTATYQITVAEPIVTSITATVNQTFHPGDMIITSDIYVEDNLGNEIVDFDFADEEYEFTYDDAPSGGGVAVKTFVDAVSYGNLKCDVSVNVSRKAYQQIINVSDVIDNSLTGLSGTAYADWTKTATNSGVTYSGYSAAGNSSVQLKSNNSNSGIVVTSNPNSLNILSVSLNWHSNTDASRTVDIYAKNTPYSAPTDLYDSSKRGTKLGSINAFSTTVFEISGSYLYVGLRSYSGALYLEDITISYGNKQSAKNVANYIMYADTDGQCENKFDFAKEYFEEMYIADKTEFMSSNDYVIATARNRFLAWARHHHIQVTYLNGDYVFSNLNSFYNYSGENLNVDNNSAVVILLIICTVGAGALSVLYLLKKKKKSI